MYTRKTRFPVSANNIPVGFYLQGNEDQVWWTYIFVTEANPQGNCKNPQEKKNDRQIVFSLSIYPWRLFPVGTHTGKLFLLFPVGILHFPVGMFTLGKFGFPVVPADALFWLIQTDNELILLSFDVHRFPVTGLKI